MTTSAGSARVCLVSFGSAGDVHPLLALGQALRARGRQVTLLSNPAFAAEAAQAGLEFAGAGSAAQLHETMCHPKLWHPVDGLGVLWRYLLRPALEPTYDALQALAARGPLVVVASPVAMGARLAQERLGVPLVTVYTAATMLRTVHDPMTLAQHRVPPWLPRPARSLAWKLLDRCKLEPLVRPALDALRGRLDLPPLRASVFGEWMHSPQAGLALFPAWFAPAAPDWPRQLVQAGFPLYDGTQAALSPSLLQWLTEGPPPVVFMPGTARHGGAAFFAAAVRSCVESGERGLLLGQVPAEILSALPQGIRAEHYAPFAALLPRARALVHHGGVGSSAQALRAGIPQLVAPQAYDQFDNGMRLQALGVAGVLPAGGAGLAAMPRQLQHLLQEGGVRAACAQWAPRTEGGSARDAVVRLVEGLA